jgi:hypothetical protein
MLRDGVRQVDFDGNASGFEPVAELSAAVADDLGRRGLVFREETEYDEPGPTRWAVVELDDGTRLLLIHHYAHPVGMLEVRAHASSEAPAMLLARLLHALDLMPEVYNVSVGWSGKAA